MERAGNILRSIFIPSFHHTDKECLHLFQNWKSIVGKELENHVILRDIRKAALIVEVAHPGWRQLVLLKKNEMIKKINSLYRGLGVNEIKVFIVKKSENTVIISHSDTAVDFKKMKENSDESGDFNIEKVLSGMDENDLKKALKRLFFSQCKKTVRRFS